MVNFSFAANRNFLFGWGKTDSLIPTLKNHEGRILIITGKSVRMNPLWESLQTNLGKEGIRYDLEQITGEPSPGTVDALTDQYRNNPPSAVAALGGGSVLDAGKAVSAMLCESGSVRNYLEGIGEKEPGGQKIPYYALPTTAGTGSECTKNAVLSQPGPEGFKKSLRHDNYIPDAAVIDPRWLESLPQEIAASCGMDAFSQLLESYMSTQASPMTDALALKGLEGFFHHFSSVLEGNALEDDYSAIALGASLSGLTLANAGLGTVHGIAGVLGGLTDIPHGTACGLLLLPVMKQTFSRLLDGEDAGTALSKAALLGRIISGNPELNINDSLQVLVEKLSGWTELAALPGLKTLGLDKELLRSAARASGNKNNPYSFSEEERFSLIHSVF